MLVQVVVSKKVLKGEDLAGLQVMVGAVAVLLDPSSVLQDTGGRLFLEIPSNGVQHVKENFVIVAIGGRYVQVPHSHLWGDRPTNPYPVANAPRLVPSRFFEGYYGG